MPVTNTQLTVPDIQSSGASLLTTFSTNLQVIPLNGSQTNWVQINRFGKRIITSVSRFALTGTCGSKIMRKALVKVWPLIIITKSPAVAGKPRDASVNFDLYGAGSCTLFRLPEFTNRFLHALTDSGPTGRPVESHSRARENIIAGPNHHPSPILYVLRSRRRMHREGGNVGRGVPSPSD